MKRRVTTIKGNDGADRRRKGPDSDLSRTGVRRACEIARSSCDACKQKRTLHGQFCSAGTAIDCENVNEEDESRVVSIDGGARGVNK